MTSTPFGVQVQKYFLNNFLKSQCEQFFNDETPRVCGSAHDGCWCCTSITHIVWRHWYFHGLNLKWSGKYHTGQASHPQNTVSVEHLTHFWWKETSQLPVQNCRDHNWQLLPGYYREHAFTSWHDNMANQLNNQQPHNSHIHHHSLLEMFTEKIFSGCFLSTFNM